MALSMGIFTVVGLIISRQAINFLKKPGERVHPGFQLYQIEPLEALSAYLKVAILIGLICSMPIIVYEIMAFVVPALTRNERKWAFPVIFATFGLFIAGAAFSYFLVIPRTLDFLLNFTSQQAFPAIRIGLYIDLLVRLVFWVGVLFELPLLMMFPAKFGIISARRYLKWWRYAIVLGFVAAAAVIPNINPIEQISVAVPIIALYFLGVGLAWFVQPKKNEEIAT
jgi:sec-independent protein translocase protein TatC